MDKILVFKRAGQERKVAINVDKILIVEPLYSMQKEIACIWVQGINKPIEVDDSFEIVLLKINEIKEFECEFNEYALTSIKNIVSIEKPSKKSPNANNPNVCYVNMIDGKTFVVRKSYEEMKKIFLNNAE